MPSKRVGVIAVLAAIAAHFGATSVQAAERPLMTYVLDSSVTSSAYSSQISASMAAAVATYNRYGVFSGPSFGSYPVVAKYSASVSTANGSGSGTLTFGGQRNTRTAQHELGHVLGSGQHANWPVLMVDGVWQGTYAQSMLKSLDGPDAEMHGDSIHFWPYGLNYDSEFDATSAVKNVLMTAAWRMDLGIGYTWPPVNGPANGTYRLTPKHATDKALRVSGGAANGAAMDIASYTGAVNQQFILERQPDGTYEISTAQTGSRNVDLYGGDVTPGSPVKLWDDNNGDNQKWIFEPNGDGYYRITAKGHLLRLLEAAGAGTADGTLAQIGEYTGTTAIQQFWKLEPAAGTDVQSIAYWHGDVSGGWNAPTGGNTNWATGYNRLTDLGRIPDALTTVWFAGGTANRTTTLGQNFLIPGLIFDGSTDTTVGGTHNLTLGQGGIVMGLMATGAATINTSGQVILSGDQTWTNHSVRPLEVESTVGGAAKLTLAGAGFISLAADNTYSGGTAFGPGTLQIGNGGTTGSILGNLTANGTLIFNRSDDATFGGVISGTGGLTKVGTGTLSLTATNSYTGGTIIGGSNSGTRFGVMRAMATNALGTGDVTLGPSGNDTTARIELSGGITLPNAFTIPQRNNSSAAVQNITGNNALSGPIALTAGGSNAIFQSDAGVLTLGAISSASGARTATLTGSGNGAVTGIIADGSGTVAVVKSGAGTWTLSDRNTCTGATTVNNNGTLTLNATADGSGNGTIRGTLNINFGATVQLNQKDALGWNIGTPANAVTQININGGTINNAVNANNGYQASWNLTASTVTSTGGGNFEIRAGNSIATNASATDSWISAPVRLRSGTGTQVTINVADGAAANDLLISGAISSPDSIGLNKTGQGTLTLSGVNSYTAATTVAAGHLIVSGTSASSITITGGTFVPSGTSSTTGDLNLQSSGRFESNIATSGAGRLAVAGSVTLAGELDIIPGPGIAPGTSFVILNKTSAGPVSGNFAGKPQGGAFAAGGYVWLVNYTGGDGNDVTLTVASAQQSWLWTNFGMVSNTGNAADTSDPDKDGLNNLLEYALGSNPNNPAASSAPQVSTNTGKLRISFTRNTAATDLTLSVVAADSLAGPWTEIARSTNGAAFTAIAPGAVVSESGSGAVRNVESTDIVLVTDSVHPKRFMRLEVKR